MVSAIAAGDRRVAEGFAVAGKDFAADGVRGIDRCDRGGARCDSEKYSAGRRFLGPYLPGAAPMARAEVERADFGPDLRRVCARSRAGDRMHNGPADTSAGKSL